MYVTPGEDGLARPAESPARHQKDSPWADVCVCWEEYIRNWPPFPDNPVTEVTIDSNNLNSVINSKPSPECDHLILNVSQWGKPGVRVVGL